MTEQAVQTLLFPTLFAKPLVATFDTPHQSADGGAILLKAIELAACCSGNKLKTARTSQSER